MEDSVLLVYDVAPEYPGGTSALFKFLQNEVQLPTIPDSISLPQRMYFEFIIDTAGRLDSLRVIRSSGYPPLDKAYFEAIQNMPRWTPGILAGKKVVVKMKMPVRIEFN